MNRLNVQLFTLLICSLLSVGCSTQYREAKLQISSEDLIQMVADINAKEGDQVVNAFTTDLTSSKPEGSTFIFHSGSAKNRPPSSVLSIDDITLIDPDWKDQIAPSEFVSSAEILISAVDVIFVDTVDSSNDRYFSLLIRIQYSQDGYYYFVASSGANEFSFSDTKFQTIVHGRNGDLVIESDDLSDEYDAELADSVKLTIYADLGNNQYAYVGQISTMAGLGNR